MLLIKPSYEFIDEIDREKILKKLEFCGRTCYKSEDKITEESASKFVRMVCKRGHESVIEHVSLTVKFVIDRGISHELIRHRIAAYSQESTRYVNYGKKGITFIIPPPPFITNIEPGKYNYGNIIDGKTTCSYTDNELIWFCSLLRVEDEYNTLIKNKWPPEIARNILPNSLKTEVVSTFNLREWKHVFKVRAHSAAHPQMREIMEQVKKRFVEELPEVFGNDD